MVVDVEVAGEAGAGVLRLVPAAVGRAGSRRASRRRAAPPRERSPAACSASSAHAVCEAVLGAAPDPRGVVVGARCPRPSRRRRSGGASSQRTARRMRGSAGATPAATSAGHGGAGAVDVVDAPAAEPGAVGLLLGDQPGERRAAPASPSASPSAASISSACAVTSALGGSITSPKSQNGSSRTIAPRVVGVERAPAAVARPASPRSSRRARAIAARRRARSRRLDAQQREHDLGGVVDVGVVVVGELERPAAGRSAGPPHRPVAAHVYLLVEQPLGGAQRSPGRRATTPASASAITASAVSQTGDWQASRRRLSAVLRS